MKVSVFALIGLKAEICGIRSSSLYFETFNPNPLASCARQLDLETFLICGLHHFQGN